MGYDVFDEALLRCVATANQDELSERVLIVVSDASDAAIGGGVFKPEGHGNFLLAREAHHMLERVDGLSAVRAGGFDEECGGVET